MSAFLSEQGARALAVLASEWFKTARRLSRITQQATPTHAERERAQIAYSKTLVEDALAENGIRLVTYEGVPFTPQLPAEPINPEDFGSEEELRVHETLEPTVVQEGRVIARGRVVLERSK